MGSKKLHAKRGRREMGGREAVNKQRGERVGHEVGRGTVLTPQMLEPGDSCLGLRKPEGTDRNLELTTTTAERVPGVAHLS